MYSEALLKSAVRAPVPSSFVYHTISFTCCQESVYVLQSFLYVMFIPIYCIIEYLIKRPKLMQFYYITDSAAFHNVLWKSIQHIFYILTYLLHGIWALEGLWNPLIKVSLSFKCSYNYFPLEAEYGWHESPR